jgi:hypothetical protein
VAAQVAVAVRAALAGLSEIIELCVIQVNIARQGVAIERAATVRDLIEGNCGRDHRLTPCHSSSRRNAHRAISAALRSQVVYHRC